jgi:beta-lactamase regulating signal transducer with metallopeptidase domain/tetratricopeptide (TPR) repeat protein
VTDTWQAGLGWLVRTAAAGGLVLLVGWLAVRLTRGPAGRVRLAGWSVRAAVLVPVLCLFPAWLTVRLPAGWVGVEPGPRVARAGAPRPVEPAAGSEADDPTPAAPPPPGEFAAVWPADLDPDPSPVRAVVFDYQPEPVPLPAAAPPPTPDDRGTLALVVLAAYVAVAGLLTVRLFVGQVGLARLVRAAAPAPARVRDVFDRLAAGLRPRPRVLVSDRVATPVCFGLVRPTVLLPRAVAAGPVAELRWVFAHELDHVRRGDPATGWWAGVARALYFFVPWLWPLRRELVLAQEHLADAAAAAAGGSPAEYAAFLVDLSGGSARVPAGAHAVRAGRSDLYRRVSMLLSSDAGSARRGSRWAVAAAAGVVSAAVLLSGVGFAAPDEDDDAPPTPRKVEKKVTKKAAPKPGDPVEVEVVIDDDAPKAKAPKAKAPATAKKSEVAELKKRIAAAAKAGDAEEVAELVEKLEKALAARAATPPAPPAPPAPGVRPAPPAPPAVRVPAAPRFDAERMAEVEAALKKALDQLKDNPEAREQVERAMKEARRAMERMKEELPKAVEEARRAAEAGRRAGEDARRQADEARRRAEQALREYQAELAERLSELPEKERAGAAEARRPRLGVAAEPLTEERAEELGLKEAKGVVVVEVLKGTPAEKAGVKEDDVILAVGGKAVEDPAGLVTVLREAKPGAEVDVVVIRGGKKTTLKGVKLAAPADGGENKPEKDPKAKPEGEKKPAKEKPAAGGEAAGPKTFKFEVVPAEGGKPLVLVRPAEGAKPLALKVEGKPAAGKTKFESTNVRINDGEFAIEAKTGETTYQVKGTLEGGKAVAAGVRITAGDEKPADYKSVDAVPAEHRAAVKQLLSGIGGGR